MRRHPYSSFLVIMALLLLGLSCGPRLVGPLSTLPSGATAGRALGPAGELSSPPKAERQPLRVIHRSPVKHAEGASAILVTFNQPMVALGASKERKIGSGECPLRVEPPIKALCRWVAGDTLKLALEQPLKNAHRYRVTIPTSLKALSGVKLPREVSWSFETPRPELRRVALYPPLVDRADRMRRDDGLLLTFNVAIDPARLAKHAELRAGDQRVPLRASRYVDPETKRPDLKRVILKSIGLLPRGAKVALSVPKGLSSTEGPLASTRVGKAAYKTPAKLAVEIRCDGKVLPAGGSCWPMNNRYHVGMTLRFSEPVTEKELKRRLRITPPLKKMLAPQYGGNCGDKRCARRWELKERLRSRTRYRLRVAGTMKDIFGQGLKAPLRTHFRTESLPPGFFAPEDAEGFREAWHAYRVKTVNLKTLELERIELKGAALVRFVECMAKKGHRWAEACKAEGKRVSRTLRAKGRQDALRALDLKLPRGVSRIELSSPELMRPGKKKGDPKVRVRVQRLVARTNLGLHARLTPFGLTTWVTTLRHGRAVAGAEVTLYDKQGALRWRGKTDSSGVAQATRAELGELLRDKKPPALYVLASHADDAAYITPSARDWRSYGVWNRPGAGEEQAKSEVKLEPLHLSHGGPWRGDRPQLVGYISTERGIYRPGHMVHIHGAVRRFRSWRGEPAAGLKVEVRLLGSNREILGRKKLTLSALGVFKLRLPLPAGGRLGYHTVHLHRGKHRLASRYLRVAEYRPPRFALHLKADKHKVVGSGSIELKLAARYMFGGVLDGAPFRLRVRESLTSEQLPPNSGHRVGASRWATRIEGRTRPPRDGVLDSQGRTRQRVAFSASKARPFVRSQRISIDVSSPARRSVSTWHYATHYPGERMVSMERKPSRDGAHYVHLLVVDPKGKRHGGERVSARLHPWHHRKKVDWERVLWKSSRVVGKKGSTLRIPWPKHYQDNYVLLVLSVKDGAGREAWSAERLRKPNVYVERWDRVGELRRQRDAQLQIVMDKKRYLPGETAVITVQRRGGKEAPAGQAMLFVERERIFERHALSFDPKGRAQVRVRVEEAYARNVTLRVVAPRVGKALRHRLGPLVTARRELRVSSKPYRLQVGLEAERAAYRPGEKVRLKIRVRDGLKRAHKAQVVLMAVDEGVLQLTGFRLPDPFRRLLHTPAIDVRADDLRRHLLSLKIPVVHRAWGRESIGLGTLGTIGHGGGSGSGYGRGSGRLGSRAKKRSRFATTAWHATLVTDDKGEASASFVLPDDLTRYRIMAFAVDAARASGTGRTSVRVALPLSTLPVLPRLLRVGDEASAGVMIQNQALPAGEVTVVAEVRGKALSLSGPTRKKVQLATGRSAMVRFALKARAAGEGELKFTISGEKGVGDVLIHRLPVKAALLREAASVSGQTKKAVAQGLAPLSTLHPSYGGLELSLSSTALTGVEDGLEQLIAYPYGCLEQLSSRLLAMIAASALGQRFEIPLPKEPRKLIEVGLSQVLAMQRRDGGFGYWPKSRKSSFFATAYALIVLKRAQLAAAQTKVVIPAEARRRALKYLRRQLSPKKGEKRRLVGDLGYAQKAMAAYALALHGERVGGLLRRLAAKRHRKPLFVRAMLLAALSTQKGHKEGTARTLREALATELSDSLRVDGTWAHAEENLHDGYQLLMHSNDRSTAMVLLALLAAQPEHAMVPRVLRWFLLGRKQARFRNTQEAAWALMAFWDYARLKEKQRPDFDAGVWLGKKKILSARFSGRQVKPRSKQISMAALMAQAGKAARQLVIAKRGKGTLYYVARLRYARKTPAAKAKDHGLKVKKSVRVLDKTGRPLAKQRPPRLGDMLLVTLKVESNEARRYVVVDDPLPAGLEAVDTMLATSGSVRVGFYNFKNDSWYDHRELRDDRVLFFRDLKQPGTLTYSYLARVTTPGHFSAPPAKAEEMYTPEVYGHTAGGRVSYKAP